MDFASDLLPSLPFPCRNWNGYISSIPCLASVYLVCCASLHFVDQSQSAHCWPSILLFQSLLGFWCLSWCVRLLCLDSGAWNVDGLFGVPVSPQCVLDSETFWHNSCPKLSPNNIKTFTVSILYLRLRYFAYIRDTGLFLLDMFLRNTCVFISCHEANLLNSTEWPHLCTQHQLS